ncbi:MAG: helix-turn-helix domain-containing protein [Candidatus Poribacteria bacterium]|nr:helix-turn-helix domain-containing protein [Candidatus Poribacteria bacterium]
MTNLQQFLSRRILQLRQDNQLSQQRLADMAGLSVDIIGKVERGESTLSLRTLNSLCRVFQISLAEFFTEVKANEKAEAIENLRLYLMTKRLEHIQFADRIIRQIIERLEVESRADSTPNN